MQKLINKLRHLWAALLLSLSSVQQLIFGKAVQQPMTVSTKTAAEEAAWWKKPTLTKASGPSETPLKRAEAFLDSGQISVPPFVKGREARIQWVYRSLPKSFWL